MDVQQVVEQLHFVKLLAIDILLKTTKKMLKTYLNREQVQLKKLDIIYIASIFSYR